MAFITLYSEHAKAIADGGKFDAFTIHVPVGPVPLGTSEIARDSAGYYHAFTFDRENTGWIPCRFVHGGEYWVREKHVFMSPSQERDSVLVVYGDDGSVKVRAIPPEALRQRHLPIGQWRRAVYMPKWASRVSVRCKSITVVAAENRNPPRLWNWRLVVEKV